MTDRMRLAEIKRKHHRLKHDDHYYASSKLAHWLDHAIAMIESSAVYIRYAVKHVPMEPGEREAAINLLEQIDELAE